MTLWDTSDVISSRGLEPGTTLSTWPDGAGQSGRGLALVSRSRPLLEDATEGRQTSDTFGPSGIGSSLQVALERSLANRLPGPMPGLQRSAMTWSHRVTRSGLRLFRLAVSVKTMSAIGSTLRATPTATANQDAPSMQKHPGCRGLEVSPFRVVPTNGVSARVAQLRAFGNAIVPQVAAAFIESYMEVAGPTVERKGEE
jgi:hypothetical protein